MVMLYVLSPNIRIGLKIALNHFCIWICKKRPQKRKAQIKIIFYAKSFTQYNGSKFQQMITEAISFLLLDQTLVALQAFKK